MSITRPTQLQESLQIEIYETRMQREYLPNDIFDMLSSEYINSTSEEPPALPNAIYLKLSAEADEGRTVKVGMLKELSGAPTIGSDADQRGSEEEIGTKSFRMEYTDISHATTNQAYGVYARDKAPYQIFEYRVEALTKYYKQYFGKMRRQALLESHSENLEDAPHFLTPRFGVNWYIPNTTNANQVGTANGTYRRDRFDWIDTIVQRIDEADLAGADINGACNVTYLQRLEEWARTEQFITPIDFEDGTDGYVVVLPTPQCRWLKSVVQNGNLGTVWRDASGFDKETKMMFPGLIGQVGGLRICEDQRYPTLTIGGGVVNSGSFKSDSAVDYTMVAQYRAMGRADDGSSDPRDKSAAGIQVGFLLGQAACCEWMPEGFHWEWDYEQYDKFFGSGIFCSVGIKQVTFDNDVTNVAGPSDDTGVQQDGSIILPFGNPPELTNYQSLPTS